MESKFKCDKDFTKCAIFSMRKLCRGCMYEDTCRHCKYNKVSIIDEPCCNCSVRGISKGY